MSNYGTFDLKSSSAAGAPKAKPDVCALPLPFFPTFVKALPMGFRVPFVCAGYDQDQTLLHLNSECKKHATRKNAQLVKESPSALFINPKWSATKVDYNGDLAQIVKKFEAATVMIVAPKTSGLSSTASGARSQTVQAEIQTDMIALGWKVWSTYDAGKFEVWQFHKPSASAAG